MKLPTGMQLIKTERRRQITNEKWTAQHDDSHTDASLSAAARSYERCAIYQEKCGKFPKELTEAFTMTPRDWPWRPVSFKPGRSVVRTFVKAGALYLAEIDRIGRAQRKVGSGIAIEHGTLTGAKNGLARVAAKLDELLG